MGVLEHQQFIAGTDRAARDERLLAENEHLLATARINRARHQRTLREADRKIRSGLAAIRRATLRAVSS